MLRTDSGRLWKTDHFYVNFWMSLIPPLDIQVPPGWKPPVVDKKLSNVILVKIFTRCLKTMIHDFHVLKVTIIRETVNFLFWHRFQRMICFFWIDITHHICKWHSRSGGRGLFLKKCIPVRVSHACDRGSFLLSDRDGCSTIHSLPKNDGRLATFTNWPQVYKLAPLQSRHINANLPQIHTRPTVSWNALWVSSLNEGSVL